MVVSVAPGVSLTLFMKFEWAKILLSLDMGLY